MMTVFMGRDGYTGDQHCPWTWVSFCHPCSHGPWTQPVDTGSEYRA